MERRSSNNEERDVYVGRLYGQPTSDAFRPGAFYAVENTDEERPLLSVSDGCLGPGIHKPQG